MLYNMLMLMPTTAGLTSITTFLTHGYVNQTDTKYNKPREQQKH